MRILGIETSCDDTGVAIYDTKAGLLAEMLYSQLDTHAPFGGVVPELASRDHVRKLPILIDHTLQQAGLQYRDLRGIAYTKGPGLAGALIVGANMAQALSLSLQIPIVGVHHLEGHLLAAYLEESKPSYPFLGLLVSGGHTELIRVKSFGCYETLGETMDDAVGEAFDKTAKLLGLDYPGGKALAMLAERGKGGRFSLPRPMLAKPGLDFSFSGLKTSALQLIKRLQPLSEQDKCDIAHAFQAAIVDTLTQKCERAMLQTGLTNLVVAGGVGANCALRHALRALCERLQGQCYLPTPALCTDNGAMIAYVGAMRLQAMMTTDAPIDVSIKPRWALNTLDLATSAV